MKLKKLICLFSIILCANLAHAAGRAGANPFGSNKVSLEEKRLLAEQLALESRKVADFFEKHLTDERARSRWEEDYRDAVPREDFGLFSGKARTNSTSSGVSK